ncbi:MAG: gnd [Herbinix sp.]|jgi:6-phosphogluconate dehydrogenase|nr:gnd [Herbinix sp.]
MRKQQVGVIGLAVMGKNLALNIAEHGFTVSVYNRSPEKTDEMLEDAKTEGLNDRVTGNYTLEEFVASLELPRKIILMVKAGEAVDDTIKLLLPLISKGDLLMDGGNSYYPDTMRRSMELEELGYHYLGTGISGGEEGARKGPSIMPGGKLMAYHMMEELLTTISAKAENEPCCTYIGENGAGHFVKMVHNGIEYADMQLISEAYFILKQLLHLTPPEFHEIFKEWNKGELNSYLIDITADIFTKKDTETGKYIVDLILDSAGQKGTGKWTGQISLDLGVPASTITIAVFERYLSSMKKERIAAANILTGPSVTTEKSKDLIESVRKALYASKICVYAQGFGLLRAASEKFGWNLKYGEIAKIFRGGCIIRAQFLNEISKAYEKNPTLVNLLLEDYFKDCVNRYQPEWREVIITAIKNGIPVPAFSSALAYYDSYRSAELPMNLLQAQRDYFGAHTYQRIDKEGSFHTQW